MSTKPKEVKIKTAPIVRSIFVQDDVEEADAAMLQKDYATALKKFRSAAAKKDAYAQFSVGDLYRAGLGVVQDHAKAVHWYRLAAKQGGEIAQYYLGVMYEKGQGVAQNYSEAVRWYKMAVEQGKDAAQFNLALKYGKGLLSSKII